jgi:hypothetical protein
LARRAVLLAERCAWRNGWGETAAKMGRGNVRAGGGAEVAVAIVRRVVDVIEEVN